LKLAVNMNFTFIMHLTIKNEKLND
jgi:hypothetical protein